MTIQLTDEQVAHTVPPPRFCVVIEDPAQSAARHAKDAEIAALTARVAELTRDRDAAIVALGEWARKAGALETRVAELSAAADAMIEYGLGYDQSGNGRHGTQTTPANQPQIVANGAIITEDRNPRGT